MECSWWVSGELLALSLSIELACLRATVWSGQSALVPSLTRPDLDGAVLLGIPAVSRRLFCDQRCVPISAATVMIAVSPRRFPDFSHLRHSDRRRAFSVPFSILNRARIRSQGRLKLARRLSPLTFG